ncbi:hypothetical protein [Anaeromassilibacillus senegalensis]|uniref:hypothetical protein n=1 Tax=Anaeromassilibacillus senegalensis TaxID=1673717 RepID=UPI0006807431|nr:hypothetical protein [Anaeromassilibacillus senegalensis]
MHQTTELYKQLIRRTARRQIVGGTITLSSGETIDLTPRNVAEGGLEISCATSQQGAFTIGAAVIGELTLTLINHEKQFEASDFTGAVIRSSIGLLTQQKWDGTKTVEWVPLGVYTVDEAVKTNATVTITALDNMARFERPYSDSKLTYPATLKQIVTDACTVCGVTLAAPDFPGSGYTVSRRPEEKSITCREILSYAAQLAGCYARCNREGALMVGWYDIAAAPYEPVGIQSSDVAAADIAVTGVQIIPQDTEAAPVNSGGEGYVVKIENNPLAQNNLQVLADDLGARLVGFTFRPYTVQCLSNPSLDVGDTVRVTDRHGTVHTSFVSNISYAPDGSMTLTADAESKLSNASTRFTAAEKLQEQVNKVEDAVTEQGTEISQTKQEIELKAYKDELISLINISPETIKIKANRIEISGVITAEDLEGEGTTTINGANIKTGRIESVDGDWWLDLESGVVYLSKGTFAGRIEWGDNSYIDVNSKGQTVLKSNKGVSVVAPVLDVDGDVECTDIICRKIEFGGTSPTRDGYDGEVGITRSDRSKRVMLFENGIFVGYV